MTATTTILTAEVIDADDAPDATFPDDPQPPTSPAPTFNRMTTGDDSTALDVRKAGVRVLSDSDMFTVVKLWEEGKSQADIAKLYRVNQATISRICTKWRNTVGTAKLIARSRTADVMTATIDDLVKPGANAEHRLEFLDRTDALPKKPKDGGGAGLTLNVGGSVERLGVQVNSQWGRD